MDTRKTLNTFAGPWAVVSIVVTAYLPPGHPRNITDRGYGGADDLPQSAVIVDVRTSFPLPMQPQGAQNAEAPYRSGNSARRRKMAFRWDTTRQG